MTPGPEGRHNNCRWRQPPVGEDEFFYSLLPRGLSAPAQGTAAPPGLVLWVNTRCGAAIELHRNLVQARRADTARDYLPSEWGKLPPAGVGQMVTMMA